MLFPSNLFFSRLRTLLPQRRSSRRIIYGGAAVLFVLYFLFMSAPFSFPAGTIITVEEGTTITGAASFLEEKSLIRSPAAFRGFVAVFASKTGVKAGDYYFPKPKSVLTLAWRLARGKHGLEPVRVTLPEGASVSEMALILEKKFPSFDKQEFLKIAARDEGYLFPDTYFFLPNTKSAEIHQALRSNFEVQMKEVAEDVAQSGYSEHEVVTMASLLEKEAFTYKDMRTIAGILWERLEIGMALQVDATFLYINGKNTFELTLDDLRKNESLYNTYKHPGLPPGPIANPGLLAIKAALNPRETPYLFYLSDLSSNIHYSRTFEEHKLKKARYLP